MADPDVGEFATALARLVQDQIAAAMPAVKASDTVLLPVKEVCSRTRFARSTIYDLMKAGQLPSVRVGHRVYIRESDLAAFIDRHAQVSA